MKVHLFENKQVNYTVFEKLFESVQNVFHLHACMHAVSRFLRLLMATSITFCCRLPDINEVMLQLTDAMKLTPVLSRPKIA